MRQALLILRPLFMKRLFIFTITCWINKSFWLSTIFYDITASTESFYNILIKVHISVPLHWKILTNLKAFYPCYLCLHFCCPRCVFISLYSNESRGNTIKTTKWGIFTILDDLKSIMSKITYHLILKIFQKIILIFCFK